MLTLVKLLLMQQGVCAFPGAAIHQDDFSHDELRDRYRGAFEYPGDKQVTVAVGGLTEKVFVVGDFGQLWQDRHRISDGNGIQTVLRMPPATWEKLRAELKSDRIDDLTRFQDAA